MNWIDSHRCVDKGVTVGKCRIGCLLFADALVAYCMRGSSQQGLELAFDRFSAACDHGRNLVWDTGDVSAHFFRRGGIIRHVPPFFSL